MRRPSFFQIFAKSPFKRLEQHMKVVQQCVNTLPMLYEACQASQWAEAKVINDQISEIESEADVIKRKLQLKLHGDLFLPVARSDVLELLQIQESIANKAEDIASLMYNRRMVFPDHLQVHMLDLLSHMLKSCKKSAEATFEMKALMEAGFEGVMIQQLEDLVKELDQLEDEADELTDKARQALFQAEKDYPPLDVLFWYQWISEVSAITDWARRVGRQLLIISAR